MVHPWIKEYILLALRIDKAFRRMDDWPFVDYYYGPAALRTAVDGEVEKSGDALTRAAIALGDALPSQDFEPMRAAFLEKHIRIMEVLCRKLSGEKFVLQEVIQQCLDIEPIWQPEAAFERALALLDQALPGTGEVRSRYQTFRKETELPRNQPELVLDLMHRMLSEARRRTQRFVPLPEEEGFDIHAVLDKPYGAANWYLGGYRSRLELNAARPVNLFSLLYQVCHEGYPGHHTEFVLKEKHLYHARGCTEQSIFMVGPQLVIAEGIASLAQEMIFTPEAAARWLAESLTEVGFQVDSIDLPKVIEALGANQLDDLGANLVFMLWRGCTDQEMFEYAMEYTPYSEAQIRREIQSLKPPLRQLYAFTYSQGKSLMRPLLENENRLQVFGRLLTEPVYPSLLAEWAAVDGK